MPKAKEFLVESIETVVILGHLIPFVPFILEGARQLIDTNPSIKTMMAIGAIEIIRLYSMQQLVKNDLVNNDQAFLLWAGSSIALGMWFQYRYQKSAT